MSWHGGWQAQHSSSGARATSLEAAVAPIHHRRESACSLDVGFVPPALQRVVDLRPLLACALGLSDAEGTDAITSTHWTDCRVGIGTEPRNWDESILFPSSQPPTPGPRPETSRHRRVKSELADANASNQRRHGSRVVGTGPGTDAMGETLSVSTLYRPLPPPW